MKCYVCGKQYEGTECPRCGFPAVEVPGASWEDARTALAATIEPFFQGFLDSISVSVTMLQHKDDNGVYVLDWEKPLILGTGKELYDRELWLDQEFARLEEPTFSVRLNLTVRGKTRTEQVELPNLKAAELQNIGIAMDKQFNLRLKLRNTSEKPTASAPVEL